MVDDREFDCVEVRVEGCESVMVLTCRNSNRARALAAEILTSVFGGVSVRLCSVDEFLKSK